MSKPVVVVHIQAMLTISPDKIGTGLGKSRPIRLETPLSDEALQSHSRVVLYYNNSGEHSAVEMAALTRETMSAALSEYPVLAGRLRRDRDDGCWEVKFNDAGIRMMQGQIDVSMAEWLKEEEGEREEKERVLAGWVDVDRERPEMSALSYVQVTEFQGDGYSIGISCSLLLADPIFLAHFLKKWAVVHRSILDQAHTETPIFHLSYFMRPNHPNRLKSISLDSSKTNPATQTTLFKLPWVSSTDQIKSFVSLCIKEATQMLRPKLESESQPEPVLKFSLFANDSSGKLAVISLCNNVEQPVHTDVFDSPTLSATSLDDELGLDEVVLSEGNRPVRVSACCVLPSANEAMVVAISPANDVGGRASEGFVCVTVPVKTK